MKKDDDQELSSSVLRINCVFVPPSTERAEFVIPVCSQRSYPRSEELAPPKRFSKGKEKKKSIVLAR